MCFSCFFVVHPGLEPRLADPESDVLPLHQWTMLVFPLESGCKSTNFFAIDKVFFDNIFLYADCQRNIFSICSCFSCQNGQIS